MTDPESYKAWLVDLDGTLYKAKGVKLAMGAELALLGAHRISILSTFRKCHEVMREEFSEDPTIQFLPNPFQEQVRRAAEQTGRSEEQVLETVLDWMVTRPGKWIYRFRRKALLARIEAFREKGGKVALVSDYPARKKLDALRAAALFDAVVSNGEHPRLTRLKPCPDGFLLAAEKLKIAPRGCLVLGDRADADGAAAKAAGMAFELVS